MPIYILNGKEIDVPENEVNQFLKAFPNAQLAEQAVPGKPDPTSQSALVEPNQALNMESRLGSTSLESQNVLAAEPAIASPVPVEDKKLSFGQSVKNSFSALAEQFGDIYEFWSGDRANLDIATAVISNEIFGQDNVDEYVKRQEAKGKSEFWTAGLGTEEITSAMSRYDQEQQESAFETRGIIESYKDGDAGGVAAGVVNALTNMVGSVGYLVGTGGAGFTFDYVADNYVNYNRQKAQNKGVSFDALVRSGESEGLTPIAIAAGQSALEFAGLGTVVKTALGKQAISKIGQNIVNKVTSSPAAAATLTSLYTSTNAGLKEYTTEISQYALEKVNEELARVDGTDDPAEIVDVTLDAIFSEEGQEQGLQGFFGGGGISVTGQNAKALIASRNFVNSKAVEKDIITLANLGIEKEKATDEIVVEGIDKKMREIENEIASKVKKGRDLYNTLTEGEIEEIDNFSKLADASAFKVSQLTAKRQSGELSDKQFNVALQGFQAEYKENKQKVSEILENKVLTGAEKIAGKIGIGFKTLKSQSEVDKFIENEKNNGNDIQASSGYGFITTNPETGKSTIIINEEVAKEDNVITTGAHELLHGVLANTLTDSTTQIKAGKALTIELSKISNALDADTDFAQRLNLYLSKAKKENIGDAWEESMTLLSEGLLNGEIEYNETVFTKLGDAIRKILSDLGIKARFDTGKDVFNFVRDYNNSLIKGELTKGQLRTVKEGATGKLVIPDKVNPESLRRFNKESVRGEDIDKFYADNPGKDFQTAEMFRGLVTQLVTKKYQDVPGFNTYKDVIIDEALTGTSGVLALVNTFTEGSLTGYINQPVGRNKDGRPVSLLERRITGIGNKILPPEFSQEITEIQEKVSDSSFDIMPEALNEIQTPIVRNTIDRLNLSPTSKLKANDATKRILGTLLPQLETNRGFNFRSEFKKGVRNLLYKDIKEELGGSSAQEYLFYVNSNLEQIYDIIPLDVMVKRLPQYVTQVVDKDGKPVRSKVSFTGKQSYAGNLVFEKKLFNEIEEDFRNDFTQGRTALETRRKLLVETVAEEAAYDEIQDALNDPNVIAKLELTQEKQLNDEFVEDIMRNAKRGAFTKYSLRLEQHVKENPGDLGRVYDLIPALNKEVKKGTPMGLAFKKLASFIPTDVLNVIEDELNAQWNEKTKANTFAIMKGSRYVHENIFKLFDVDSNFYSSTQTGIKIGGKVSKFKKITKELFDKGILTPEIMQTGALKNGVLKPFTGNLSSEEYTKFFNIPNASNPNLNNIPPNYSATATLPKFRKTIVEAVKEFLTTGKIEQKLIDGVNSAKRHREVGRKLMLDLMQEYQDGNIPTDYMLTIFNGFFQGGTTTLIRSSAMPAKVHTDFMNISVETAKTAGKDQWYPEHMDPIEHLQGLFLYGNGKFNLYNALRNPAQSQEILNKAIDLMYERNGIVMVPKKIADAIPKTFVPDHNAIMARMADVVNIEQLKDFPSINELNTNLYSNDGLFANVKEARNTDTKNVKFSLRKTKKFAGKELSNMLDRLGERPKQIKSGAGSQVTARKLADDAKLNWKNKWNLYLPFNAEDFYGLIQNFAGKGKQGDEDLKILKEYLLDPYVQGTNDIDVSRRTMMDNFKIAKNKLYENKSLKFRKKLTQENINMFDNEDAIRVYLWNKAGYTIPELNKNQERSLVKYVESSTELLEFAGEMQKIHKTDGYPKPENSWDSATIGIDMANSLNDVQRKKYLARWNNNVDIMLNERNKAKIVAQFGTDFLDNLEKQIKRMKAGSNRIDPTGNKTIDAIMDYINDSVGTIMFWNMRSALLQLLSTFNYMNWNDNNPLKFGQAMLDVDQYKKDWLTLFNSDYLTNRREGVKLNIQEAELADALNEPKNRGRNIWGVVYRAGKKQLRNGFIPTKYADSVAISTGGAAFYRNRVNSYLKQGLSEKESESKALLDWKKLTNEAQQSSDPARIANIQAGPLGRLVFAFANTPFQYARLSKRALKDLINGRGDNVTNLSKIGYYTVLQNLGFNMLQSAAFAALFDEDEDEEFLDKKTERVLNGMVDSVLRGTGFGGAALSMVKNVALKLKDESEEPNQYMKDVDSAVMSVSDISPPIDHKLRKLQRLSEIVVGKNYYDTNIPPSVEAAANAAALVNIPADRVLKKMENLYEASAYEMKLWQRVLMAAGWSSWDLGVEGEKLFEGGQSEGKGTTKVGVKKLKIKKIN